MTEKSQQDTNDQKPTAEAPISEPVKQVAKRRYTFLKPDEEEEITPGASSNVVDPTSSGSDKQRGYNVYQRAEPNVDSAQLYSHRANPELAVTEPITARLQDAAVANSSAAPTESAAKPAENQPDPAKPQEPVYAFPGSVVSLTFIPDAPKPDPSAVPPPPKRPTFFSKLRDSATGRSSPFLAISVGLGIPLVFLLVIGVVNLLKPPPAVQDLGAGVFNLAGIQGHLVVRWNGKAEYRLRIEPLGMQHYAGFATAVDGAPQPAFFDLQLKDAAGFVVCKKRVLLRFNPAQSAALAAAISINPHAKPTAVAAADQAAQEAQIQTQIAQQPLREQGSDLFQNEVSKDDGRIEAIEAQGDIPCDKVSYRRLDYWEFSTNFPTIDEQQELLRHQAYLASAPAAKPVDVAPLEHANAGHVGNAIPKNQAAPIEGDDLITGYTSSNGIVRTNTGNVFVVDKTWLHNSAVSWHVFPAPIHYKCDKKGVCVLTRPDVGAVMHARLKR